MIGTTAALEEGVENPDVAADCAMRASTDKSLIRATLVAARQRDAA